jgi:hypothetical protein
MPDCADSGEIGGVSLRASEEMQDYSLSKAPIDARARTFQESFMSPRMLIYSKQQFF